MINSLDTEKFDRLIGLPNNTKANLDNVSLICEGQCFNVRNFFVIYIEIFDVEKFIGELYWLNHGFGVEKLFFDSTNLTFSNSDSKKSNNTTPTSAHVKKRIEIYPKIYGISNFDSTT